MPKPFPFPLMEDAARMAQTGGWTQAVYQDLLDVDAGRMTEEAFRLKYRRTAAILQLDMTKMTESAMQGGAMLSFRRILNAQKVCMPVFIEHGATHIRTFADDFTAIFDKPETALDAALEVHRRMAIYNSGADAPLRVSCCIGLGYGEVLAIGVDRAMGDEMNRASKLGEDTAKAGETLLTENFHAQVKHRTDCAFEHRRDEDLPFAFFSATRK